MEPMVPEEAARGLEDGAVTLIAQANRLAGRVHPILQESVGALVRSMNCYYSNLIEGHDTHPRDIDRALANNFSAEPRKRELQRSASGSNRIGAGPRCDVTSGMTSIINFSRLARITSPPLRYQALLYSAAPCLRERVP